MGRAAAVSAARQTSRRHGGSSLARGMLREASRMQRAIVSDGVAVTKVGRGTWMAWRTALLAELRALGPSMLWPAAGAFGAIGDPVMAFSPTVYAIDKHFSVIANRMLMVCAATRDRVRTAKTRMFDDRVGIRPDTGWITYDGRKMFGSSIPAETAHRDMSASTDDTLTCGGFVNLGLEPQFFECVPGTGLGFRAKERAAFSKISPSIQQQMVKYKVQPGEAILFDSTIVHRVAQGYREKDPPEDASNEACAQLDAAQLRKYVSFWMTVSEKERAQTPDAQIARYAKYLAIGKYPPLPSMQKVPLFPANWNMHPDRREAFLKQYRGKYTDRFPSVPSVPQLKYPEERRAIYEVLPGN